MRITAEFRAFIATAIPQVITLLNDRDWEIHREAIDSLAKLSQQGKITNFFYLLSRMSITAALREFIAPAIPCIITLLSDAAWKLRKEAVNALTILLEQGSITNILI